jgi:hypothetical protein
MHREHPSKRRLSWLMLVVFSGFLLVSPTMPLRSGSVRNESTHETAPLEEATNMDVVFQRNPRPQRGDVCGRIRLSDFLLMLSRDTSGGRLAARQDRHGLMAARQNHNGCGAPLRC